MQRVEKRKQWLPLTGLNGLTAVVTEAEVDSGWPVEGVEDAVYRFSSERAVFRVARNVGFVDLEAGAGKILHLFGEDVGNR